MGIENVQARVGEIQARIQSVLGTPNAQFQSILQDKLGVSQQTTTQGTMDTASAQTALYNTLTQDTGVPTGRYCAKCGTPELMSSYGASYTAAVDTSDGMIEKAAPYMDIIEEAAQTYGVPVNLIMGIIKAESDFNPQCVSGAGAKGLMQIMPENAREFGVTDVYDARQNIFCGVDEVARLIDKYDGDVKLALAAYNTGPGNIAKRGVTSSNSSEYLTVPQSIRDYADRVLGYAGLRTLV